LPGAAVHCIFQDSEGYIWHGTERAGVCRDNGYQIDVFRPSDTGHGASADRILCIGETRAGDILAGTPEGLFRIGKQDYALHRTALDSVQVNALHTDRRGTLWAGTEDGRVVSLDADLRVDKVFPCTLADGSRCPVTRFFEDADGRLFVLQWGGGLLLKAPGEHRLERLHWPAGMAWPVQMVEASGEKDVFWTATFGDGIVRCTIAGDSCRVEREAASQGSAGRARNFSLLRDNWHGWLWASAADGLYAYRVSANGHLQQVPTDSLLPQGKKIIDQLLLSRKGDIYVAGYTPHTFILTERENPVERMPVAPMRRQTGYPLLANRSVSEGRNRWIWQGRIGLTFYDAGRDLLTFAPWRMERGVERNTSLKQGLWAFAANHIYNVYRSGERILRKELTALPDSQAVCHIRDDGHRNLYVATKRMLYRLHLSDGKPEALARLAAHRHGACPAGRCLPHPQRPWIVCRSPEGASVPSRHLRHLVQRHRRRPRRLPLACGADGRSLALHAVRRCTAADGGARHRL